MQDDLKEKLERWLGPKLFLDKAEVTRKTTLGDNYLSDAYGLKLIGHIGNEKRPYEKNVFVKKNTRTDGILDAALTERAFKNESLFYTEFLEGLSITPCVPRCYGADSDVIVMEDLQRDGFVSEDRRVDLTEPHMRLILQELAKLHSCSYYLKRYKLDQFNEVLSKLEQTIPDELAVEFFKNSLKAAVDVLKEEKDLYNDMIELLECYFHRDEKLLQVLNNFNRGDKNTYVIVHGDCWLKNLMFRYDKENRPVEVCLLDFQNIKLATPVADLVTVIWANARPGFDYVDLIKHYHSTLTRSLQTADIQPPSLSNIIKDYEALSINGLLISILYIGAMCLDESAIGNCENQNEVVNKLTNEYKLMINSLYKDRIKLNVNYYKNKYMNKTNTLV